MDPYITIFGYVSAGLSPELTVRVAEWDSPFARLSELIDHFVQLSQGGAGLFQSLKPARVCTTLNQLTTSCFTLLFSTCLPSIPPPTESFWFFDEGFR